MLNPEINVGGGWVILKHTLKKKGENTFRITVKLGWRLRNTNHLNEEVRMQKGHNEEKNINLIIHKAPLIVMWQKQPNYPPISLNHFLNIKNLGGCVTSQNLKNDLQAFPAPGEPCD